MQQLDRRLDQGTGLTGLRQIVENESERLCARIDGAPTRMDRELALRDLRQLAVHVLECIQMLDPSGAMGQDEFADFETAA